MCLSRRSTGQHGPQSRSLGCLGPRLWDTLQQCASGLPGVVGVAASWFLLACLIVVSRARAVTRVRLASTAHTDGSQRPESGAGQRGGLLQQQGHPFQIVIRCRRTACYRRTTKPALVQSLGLSLAAACAEGEAPLVYGVPCLNAHTCNQHSPAAWTATCLWHAGATQGQPACPCHRARPCHALHAGHALQRAGTQAQPADQTLQDGSACQRVSLCTGHPSLSSATSPVTACGRR
jgi:hypothetical protein